MKCYYLSLIYWSSFTCGSFCCAISHKNPDIMTKWLFCSVIMSAGVSSKWLKLKRIANVSKRFWVRDPICWYFRSDGKIISHLNYLTINLSYLKQSKCNYLSLIYWFHSPVVHSVLLIRKQSWCHDQIVVVCEYRKK